MLLRRRCVFWHILILFTASVAGQYYGGEDYWDDYFDDMYDDAYEWYDEYPWNSYYGQWFDLYAQDYDKIQELGSRWSGYDYGAWKSFNDKWDDYFDQYWENMYDNYDMWFDEYPWNSYFGQWEKLYDEDADKIQAAGGDWSGYDYYPWNSFHLKWDAYWEEYYADDDGGTEEEPLTEQEDETEPEGTMEEVSWWNNFPYPQNSYYRQFHKLYEQDKDKIGDLGDLWSGHKYYPWNSFHAQWSGFWHDYYATDREEDGEEEADFSEFQSSEDLFVSFSNMPLTMGSTDLQTAAFPSWDISTLFPNGDYETHAYLGDSMKTWSYSIFTMPLAASGKIVQSAHNITEGHGLLVASVSTKLIDIGSLTSSNSDISLLSTSFTESNNNNAIADQSDDFYAVLLPAYPIYDNGDVLLSSNGDSKSNDDTFITIAAETERTEVISRLGTLETGSFISLDSIPPVDDENESDSFTNTGNIETKVINEFETQGKKRESSSTTNENEEIIDSLGTELSVFVNTYSDVIYNNVGVEISYDTMTHLAKNTITFYNSMTHQATNTITFYNSMTHQAKNTITFYNGMTHQATNTIYNSATSTEQINPDDTLSIQDYTTQQFGSSTPVTHELSTNIIDIANTLYSSETDYVFTAQGSFTIPLTEQTLKITVGLTDELSTELISNVLNVVVSSTKTNIATVVEESSVFHMLPIEGQNYTNVNASAGEVLGDGFYVVLIAEATKVLYPSTMLLYLPVITMAMMRKLS